MLAEEAVPDAGLELGILVERLNLDFMELRLSVVKIWLFHLVAVVPEDFEQNTFGDKQANIEEEIRCEVKVLNCVVLYIHRQQNQTDVVDENADHVQAKGGGMEQERLQIYLLPVISLLGQETPDSPNGPQEEAT